MTVERPRLHWKYLWDAVLLAILVAMPCFFAAKAAAQAPQPVTPAPAPSWQNILIDGSVTVPAPQPMPATEAAGGKSGAGESGDAADISITVPVPVPTRPGAPPAEPPRLPAFSRLLPIEPPVVRSTPSATPSSIQLVSAPVGNSTAQLSTPLIQDRAPLSDVTAPSPAPAQIPIGPPGVTPLPGEVNPGGVVFPPMEGNSAAPGKQGTSLPAPGAVLPEPRLIGPQPGIPEQVPFPYPPSGTPAPGSLLPPPLGGVPGPGDQDGSGPFGPPADLPNDADLDCGCAHGRAPCVPGQKPCCPCPSKTFFGACLCELYECICCPDPCYDPHWLPLADAAYFVDAARPQTQERIRWEDDVNLLFPDRSEYFWARAEWRRQGARSGRSLRRPGNPEQ